MVVEYLDAGRTPPFVRGAFVASSDVDDLLRQTEPKAHDSWETDVATLGIDPAAPVVAKSILDRVRRNVRDFRDRLKPPAPLRREVHLTEFDRLLNRVLRGGQSVGARRAPRRSAVEVELLEQRTRVSTANPQPSRWWPVSPCVLRVSMTFSSLMSWWVSAHSSTRTVGVGPRVP